MPENARSNAESPAKKYRVFFITVSFRFCICIQPLSQQIEQASCQARKQLNIQSLWVLMGVRSVNYSDVIQAEIQALGC
jgi:hypothetical protein